MGFFEANARTQDFGKGYVGFMYKNAMDILPKSLLEQVQKYVQGQEIYIPKRSQTRLRWGEANGTRKQLDMRNRAIVSRYMRGESIESLMEEFHLSYDSIRKIVRKGKKELFR
ncbi:MAG: helix-turn-helix domain-containing protein [Bacillota bacterium]